MVTDTPHSAARRRTELRKALRSLYASHIWMPRAAAVREALGQRKNDDQTAALLARVFYGLDPEYQATGEPPPDAVHATWTKAKDFVPAVIKALETDTSDPPAIQPQTGGLGVSTDAKNVTGGPDGSKLQISGTRGRCIGFDGGKWFGWSRLSSCQEKEVLAHVESKWQRARKGTNIVVLACSTWHRPEMNERPFHGLEEKQRLLDRAGLFDRLGYALWVEGCTLEYAMGPKSRARSGAPSTTTSTERSTTCRKSQSLWPACPTPSCSCPLGSFPFSGAKVLDAIGQAAVLRSASNAGVT